MPRKAWTRERLAALMDGARVDPGPRARRPDPALAELRRAYCRAAAVLTVFDPVTLKPVGVEAEDPAHDALGLLARDARVVPSEGEGLRWTLRTSVRRDALRAMDRSAMLAALDANPNRPRDMRQRMLERCLRGESFDLDACSFDELTHLLQALRWLRGSLEGLPPEDEIRRRLDLFLLLRPFELLVEGDTGDTDRFQGRRSELAMLRDHVGVLEASSVVEGAKRSLRSLFNLQERGPLVIHGPGGVGKSTLLARFLLEHARLEPERRIPFAHLDFEVPGLVGDRPLTLLLAMLDDLRVQYPELTEDFDALGQQVQEASEAQQQEIERFPAEFSDEALRSHRAQVRLQRVGREVELTEAFAKSLRTVLDREWKPFLLVLDTFEEVQLRSREQIRLLWGFLERLQHALPTIRIVVSGRLPLEGLQLNGRRALEKGLGPLDADASVAFLHHHGVDDPALAQAIARQVKGHPLSLVLAARVVEREGGSRSEGIEGLVTRRLLFAVGSEEVQGQLYRRYLDHLTDDPDVRRLAHPGLVLRRITPALIAGVLAEPCGLGEVTEERAQGLFDRLKAEITLVTVDTDGALRHRPDLRRVMLHLLGQEKPQQVEAIHRGAIEFYGEHATAPAERAERLYHLIALGEDRDVIEEAWFVGAEQYLSGVLEEVPLALQPMVASRLGIELPPEVWERADLADWERQVARKVRRLMGDGRHEEALALMAKRPERTPASVLYVLEATSLLAVGEAETALRVCRAGLDSTPEGGVAARPVAVELLMRLAEAVHRSGDLDATWAALDEAAELAEQGKDTRRSLAIDTLRLSLARETPGRAEGREQELRESVSQRLEDWERGLPDNEPVAKGPPFLGSGPEPAEDFLLTSQRRQRKILESAKAEKASWLGARPKTSDAEAEDLDFTIPSPGPATRGGGFSPPSDEPETEGRGSTKPLKPKGGFSLGLPMEDPQPEPEEAEAEEAPDTADFSQLIHELNDIDDY